MTTRPSATESRAVHHNAPNPQGNRQVQEDTDQDAQPGATVNQPRPLPAGAATALQLRLTHSHGLAAHGICLIPAGGAGMAEALQLGGERLSQVQWQGANLCRIALAPEGWEMLNRNAKLVCSLDGERLPPQRATPVSAGQVLEIGLMRFVLEAVSGSAHGDVDDRLTSRRSGHVAADALAALDAAASGTRQTSRLQPSRAIAGPDEDDFDLRDLASGPTNAAEPPRSGGADLDSPFGVLNIAGAAHVHAQDTLAALLDDRGVLQPARRWSGANPIQEAPLTDRAPTLRHATQPSAAFVAVGDGQSSAWTAEDRGGNRNDDGLGLGLGLGVGVGDTDGHYDGDAPADLRLMQELHQEFVRVVRDPSQLTGRLDWDSLADPGHQAAPSIEELIHQASAFERLRDIVLPSGNIDGIIHDFDPLRQSTLLEEAPPDDILHLFAPQLARTVGVSVPSLTRREHHALSPDSYIEIGAFKSQGEAQ